MLRQAAKAIVLLDLIDTRHRRLGQDRHVLNRVARTSLRELDVCSDGHASVNLTFLPYSLSFYRGFFPCTPSPPQALAYMRAILQMVAHTLAVLQRLIVIEWHLVYISTFHTTLRSYSPSLHAPCHCTTALATTFCDVHAGQHT